MRLLTVTARPLLASMFVAAGADAVRSPGQRTKAAEKLGLPQPELAVRANGAVMTLAGLALGLGYRPKLSALLLLGTLAPVTYGSHAFWEEHDGGARQAQAVEFLRDVAVAGGLLSVIGTPSRKHEKRLARKAARRAARAARKQAAAH